ncbi:hypothetical protein [Enterovibrio norvegicus]|uniref:Uncharacterized protein n=1 Tax=Enterovibrio norvegicus TaxID=188144 RepID=A0ABV4LAP4_9GAMM|nr:hypothetical protein [Enterovibrio norvegicus]OEF55827.1 hypothetical protein A1OU_13645 [Enterovibrio norvegicus]
MRTKSVIAIVFAYLLAGCLLARQPYDMSKEYFDLIVYQLLPGITVSYLFFIVFGKVGGRKLWALRTQELDKDFGFNKWQVLLFSGVVAYPVFAILLQPIYQAPKMLTYLIGNEVCFTGQAVGVRDNLKNMPLLNELTIRAPNLEIEFYYSESSLLEAEVSVGSSIVVCGKKDWFGFYVDSVYVTEKSNITRA